MVDGNKFAVSGTSRDGSGLPLKLSRRMAGGYVLGHVHVEDRVLEGGFQEKDLKYISESDFKEFVKKQNRIAGGKKANAKRNSDKGAVRRIPENNPKSGGDAANGSLRGTTGPGGAIPEANTGESQPDTVVLTPGADSIEITINPNALRGTNA